jgi:hypothetical protein
VPGERYSYVLRTIPLVDSNPYAAPTTIIESAFEIVDKAKPRLARPATALIVMASTQSVFAAIVLVCGTIDFLTGRRIWPPLASTMSTTETLTLLAEALTLLTVLLLFLALVAIAIGAAKMGFVESYAMARLAAILACIPIVSPFIIIGIPFGFWSLRLLAKPEIIQAFQATRHRRKTT